MSTKQMLETRLAAIQKRYEDEYESIADKVSVYDNRLKDALTDQVPLELLICDLDGEIRYLYDLAEHYRDEALSKANDKLMNSQRMYNSTEVKRLAENDRAYLDMRLLVIEIGKLKSEISGVKEVVTTRRYILNNLTNAVIASVDGHTL